MSTDTITVEVQLDAADVAAALRADVWTGLRSTPKWLPPKWFYDERGSLLFDEITRLPEYYPTRRETAILEARAAEIASVTGAGELVELGSGMARKTRLLLDGLTAAGTLERFVPVDVSEEVLRASGARLAAGYPGLTVHGVVADFERHLDLLPSGERRLVAFLGGTIGNLVPAERTRFLSALATVLRPGEWLLLGTDLVKDVGRLVPAYDDAAGVTAEFNRNVLRVVNRELDADFPVDRFAHVARWNADQEWIEMWLRSEGAQRVRIGALDLEVEFAPGEEMRTEISAKFRREGVEAELAAAGFDPVRWWTDPAGDFALSLAKRPRQ